MPPPSSKTQLIEAALEIIESEGLPALTYESLAARTGKSRSGILYHFPSKEAMIADVRRYTVEQWNTACEKHLDGTFAEASPVQRAHAYISATVEEQAAAGEDHYQEALDGEFIEEVWREVRTRWVDCTEGVLSAWQHMAALAADGLWLDYGPERLMPDSTRQQVIDQILAIMSPDNRT